LDKLKIVHIIQSMATGGAEKMVLDLAIECNSKHFVTIICLYPSRDYLYEKIAKENNIKMIFLNKKIGLDLNSYKELWSVLSKIKPDVIHTHMHAAIYALPWFVFHRKNARIHTVHSIATMEIEKLHRIIQRIAYKFANAVPVAISQTVQEGIMKEYGLNEAKVPVIYNGIDTKKFPPILSNKNNDKFTIINVASFSKWKNQKLLIDAFHIALNERQDLRLIFVGDGKEKVNVEARAKDYKINDKIEFVGITSNVSEWLSKANVFILCSTFEGFPLSIIEAMSAGLPVISTDVGGVGDVVKSSINGFLVPSNDALKLSQAILKLANDTILQQEMSEANIKKSKEFDISIIAGEYIQLYRKKLGEVN